MKEGIIAEVQIYVTDYYFREQEWQVTSGCGVSERVKGFYQYLQFIFTRFEVV
jgi:hypothetical protein